jgi:hypothetical protein
VITTVPAETPVTTPVEEPTVARAVLLLVQVPPDTGYVRVVVVPAQIAAVPDIAAELDNTVTELILKHVAFL